MSIKKYQIFVSSTFRDLSEERQDAIKNILDLKHIPAGMELFPASDIDQFDYIKKVIDECDYYLLIIGGRYGSIDSSGLSYTEREYDYAVSIGKFVLAFIHDDPGSITVSKSDTNEELLRSLNSFRQKVKTGRLVRTWTTRQDLEPLVLKALIHAFNDFPQIGWIRGDAAATDALLEESNKALRENAVLREQLAKIQQANTLKFTDLADLADYVELRYRTRYKSGSYSSTYSYTDRVCKFTWRQLFLATAKNLKTSRTDAIIETAFKEVAEDIKLDYTPYDLNSTDLTKIKVQFIALGLIKSKVSTSTTGSVAEFLSLTEKGREIFMNEMVVRKKPALDGAS